MLIKYFVKSVYGNDCNYPASDDARLICELTGRKTLSEADLKKLADHGAAIEKVIAP